MSKTVIFTFLLSYLPQALNWIEGKSSTIAVFAAGLTPDFLDPFVLEGVPLAIAALVTLVARFGRNSAVKAAVNGKPTKATITGAKKAWGS